ncbi:MAG: hypothetical protein ACFFCS_26900 [Candidatus Hodarchaeota archaeon]
MLDEDKDYIPYTCPTCQKNVLSPGVGIPQCAICGKIVCRRCGAKWFKVYLPRILGKVRKIVWISICSQCIHITPKELIRELQDIKDPTSKNFLDKLVQAIVADYGLGKAGEASHIPPATQPDPKFCPTCGGNDVSGGMCYDCGAKICPKCGYPDTSANPEVCSKCGTKFY